MHETYFVMLTTQQGSPTPLMGDNDEIALYGSEEQARKDAAQNLLGEAFGFEIFRQGDGSV